MYETYTELLTTLTLTLRIHSFADQKNSQNTTVFVRLSKPENGYDLQA